MKRRNKKDEGQGGEPRGVGISQREEEREMRWRN